MLFQGRNLRVEINGSIDTGERQAMVATLWLDVPGERFNVLSCVVLDELEQALEALKSEPIRVLLVRSAKETGFVAGADVRDFAHIQSASEAEALSARGQQLFNRLAMPPATSVAIIHGPCLGGGLELALACSSRLAVDQPGTQLGLPEVELGLLPGWGGTQRLPRVVGVENALRMILTGRRLNARESKSWGLVDALLPDPKSVDPLELARHAPWSKSGQSYSWRRALLESNPLGRRLLFRAARKHLARRVPDDMPAPYEALRAVEVGASQGIEAGLAYERAAIGRLSQTSACRNLIKLFFLRERARQLPTDDKCQAVRPIQRVGVVGAGTMGAGIAQLAAIKGFEVVVQEINEQALASGLTKIEDLFQQAVDRQIVTPEEARSKLEAIGRTTTCQDFERVDLVVEAVVEDLELKRKAFQELEARTSPTTILATNTSSLLVREIQQGLFRRDRVAAVHFFNPVHKMPLVEVARTAETDSNVVSSLLRWVIALGKTPVVVKDSPGFLVNRILMPYLNEAAILVGEGMSIEQVDRVMRRFGMPMGPLELLDQVGLDVAAHIARTIQPVLGSWVTPNPLFEEMAKQGWLGQKAGIGFYRYRGAKQSANSQLASSLKSSASEVAARDRMVLLMVNEAGRCLEEQVVRDAETIDLAMIFGSGWAPHRGGPLRYADERGLAEVIDALDRLTLEHGSRFEPCADLRRRAKTGDSFYRAKERLLEMDRDEERKR